MIQRKQTIFLVLGAAFLLAILFFSDLRTGVTATALSWFIPVVYGLVVLGAVGAIGSTFLYNNREKQRTVVLAIQMLTLLLVITLFVGLYMTDMLPVVTGAAMDVTSILGLILPILAYLSFMLARRGIEGDIKLVKSMDRLR